MVEVSEHVGMNYPYSPDCSYVPQPFVDFLFPYEEGSVDFPMAI